MNETTLLTKLNPRSKRLVVSRGSVGLRGEQRTGGGLYVPEIAERRRREHGLVCRALKVAPDVCDIAPGDLVLISEFTGTPVRGLDGDETVLWIIGEGDVMAVLDAAPGEVQLETDLPVPR